jgi:hypothetical protein
MIGQHYPETPFHRGIDTSIAAAASINQVLPRLQSSVLGVILGAGERGSTADEVSLALGWERFRVRPRASELRKAGRIIDSGRRRDSLSGIASIVWVAREYAGGGQ